MARAALVAVALLATACATAPPKPAALSTPHQAHARALEADGLLHEALLEWKVARTVDPDNAEVKAEHARLEARIQGLVAERLDEARTSLSRKAHLEARRKLLSVLVIDPANATAADLLRTQVREVDFVLHTVRAGDTLTSLAERYYGDRARGEVIWETNQLPPSRPLVAGSVLKVPEIPGLPFYAPGRKPPPAPPTAVAAVPPPAVPAPPTTPPQITVQRPSDKAQEEPPEVNPILADAREAVDRREYAAALEQVDQYLAQNPRDREGIDLKKVTLYRYGQSLLEQKKYDESYRALTQLARIQPDYQDVGKLVQQARRQVIDRHYQEGIRFFREEKLKEAIAEWRLVLEMEPQNQNAKRNVEQAERMLQGLERRKR
ncbi:MAG TPA: LysM peptidoglycan-binding domain-containing protein [Methylomirabilota bacterium]|nr:LysM peptidoglycan-binding domain-containing protein [Methylomirabilota bacterium]